MEIKKYNFFRIVKENILFFSTIIIFSFHQIYYIKKVGTNIDEYVHILGVELTLEKFDYIFNNFPWNDYLNYSDIEFYGYVYEIQAYFFSNSNLIKTFFNLFISFDNYYQNLYFLRHIYLTIYLIIITSLIRYALKIIIDKTFADIFVIILFLIPIYNGYSLTNHKDTTYALHLFAALCFYFLFFRTGKHLLLTSFLISYVTLLRFNAIAFIVMYVLILNLKIDKFKIKNLITSNFKLGLIATVFYLLGCIPGWPILFKYIKNLYFTQFKYAWIGSTLVNGYDYNSLNYRFDYLIKNLFFKFPIIFIVICFFSLYFIYKNKNIFLITNFYFLITVNIAFIIYRPNVYDYLRQYLFLIPFLVSLASYFFYVLFIQYFKKFVFLFLMFIIYMSQAQYGLEEFKYTYINELVRADSITNEFKDCNKNLSVCGTWSTDFYGYSGLELFKSNLKSTNLTFICTYEHIYSDFIKGDNTIYSNNIDDINNEYEYFITSKSVLEQLINTKKINKFEVVAIHRINSYGGTCVDDFDKSKVNCKLENSVSRKLRFKEVNMSYQFICQTNEI